MAAKSKTEKSCIVFDVKPFDDETDMKDLEEKVREITRDGLLWGEGRLVPLIYNLKKLQIMCIVEDDKVSVEELTEAIENDLEEIVQSVDINSFSKV